MANYEVVIDIVTKNAELALKRLKKEVDTLTRAAEAMRGAATQSAAALKKLPSQLGGVGSALSNVDSSAERAAQSIGRMTDEMAEASQGMIGKAQGLYNAIAPIATVALGAASAVTSMGKAFIRSFSQIEDAAGLLGDVGITIEQLKKDADEVGAALALPAAGKFAGRLKGVLTSGEIAEEMKQLQIIASALAASPEELARASLGYSQIVANARLSTEDIFQITENLGLSTQAFVDVLQEMGYEVNSIQEFTTQYSDAIYDVVEILDLVTDRQAEFLGDRARSNASLMSGEMNKLANEWVLFTKILGEETKPILKDVLDYITLSVKGMKVLVNGLAGALGGLYEALSAIPPAIAAIVPGLPLVTGFLSWFEDEDPGVKAARQLSEIMKRMRENEEVLRKREEKLRKLRERREKEAMGGSGEKKAIDNTQKLREQAIERLKKLRESLIGQIEDRERESILRRADLEESIAKRVADFRLQIADRITAKQNELADRNARGELDLERQRSQLRSQGYGMIFAGGDPLEDYLTQRLQLEEEIALKRKELEFDLAQLEKEKQEFKLQLSKDIARFEADIAQQRLDFEKREVERIYDFRLKAERQIQSLIAETYNKVGQALDSTVRNAISQLRQVQSALAAAASASALSSASRPPGSAFVPMSRTLADTAPLERIEREKKLSEQIEADYRDRLAELDRQYDERRRQMELQYNQWVEGQRRLLEKSFTNALNQRLQALADQNEELRTQLALTSAIAEWEGRLARSSVTAGQNLVQLGSLAKNLAEFFRLQSLDPAQEAAKQASEAAAKLRMEADAAERLGDIVAANRLREAAAAAGAKVESLANFEAKKKQLELEKASISLIDSLLQRNSQLSQQLGEVAGRWEDIYLQAESQQRAIGQTGPIAAYLSARDAELLQGRQIIKGYQAQNAELKRLLENIELDGETRLKVINAIKENEAALIALADTVQRNAEQAGKLASANALLQNRFQLVIEPIKQYNLELQALEAGYTGVAAAAFKARAAGELSVSNEELGLLQQAEEGRAALAEIRSLADSIAGSITSSMTGAFNAIIDGTFDVQDAFSRLFRDIGNSFFDLAASIIKTQLSNAIFGSLGGLFGGATPIPIPAFASGGIVSAPTIGMVGEAGPEAIVPLKNFDTAPAQITVNAQSVRMNGSDYVTLQQLENAVQQAEQLGAQRALSMIRNNPGVRRQIGV